MKEIRNIKIVSLFLCLIPITTLILIVSISNHLTAYERGYFPNGVAKNYIFKCDESNKYCLDSIFPGKIDNLSLNFETLNLIDCNKNAYKYGIYKDEKLIYQWDYINDSILTDKENAIELVNNKIEHIFKISKTEKKNTKCIKFSKIYFLYKIFPKLENTYNFWKINSDFGVTKKINPFIFGETSISNIAKRVPLTNIFNPLMYITSILMLIFWLNYYFFFKNIDLNKNNKFLYFGILSSIFLFLHILFLNGNIDIENSNIIRRIIIFVFLLSELLAEFFLAKKIYDNKNILLKYMKNNIINYKLYFVYIILFITSVSLGYMGIVDQSQAFNHILEWNYFVLLSIFYLFSNFIWRKII